MSRRTVEDSRRFDHFPLSLHYFLAFAFAPKISNTSPVPLSWTPSSFLLPPLSNPADQPKIQIAFASPTSRHPLRDTDSRWVPAKASKTSPGGGGDWRRRPLLAAEVPTESKEKKQPMDATNPSQAIEGKKILIHYIPLPQVDQSDFPPFWRTWTLTATQNRVSKKSV